MPFKPRAGKKPKTPPKLTWRVVKASTARELEDVLQEFANEQFFIHDILSIDDTFLVVAYRNDTRMAALAEAKAAQSEPPKKIA